MKKNKKREIEKEKRIIEKLNNSVENKLQENAKEIDDKSSVTQTEKLRQSLISEIELDIREIAKKRALNDNDLETYKKIDLGELHSELGDMLEENSRIMILLNN